MADFNACVVNNDQTFYRNDLGVVGGVRSFNGTAEAVSNFSDPSSLACGTYYYAHTPGLVRPSCVIQRANGTVLRNDGLVTVIKQKCFENVPLDDHIPVVVVLVGFVIFLYLRN